MKVLLTGASGFLGSYVLSCLTEHRISTVVAGRSLPTNAPSMTEFLQVDLLQPSDFSALVAKSGATHLVHLAWYAEHGKYWTSPLNLRWTEATVRLVEAFCQSRGEKVVIAGTCAEYDWSYGYCQEDVTPLNPSTLYGIAKDATRRLAHAVCLENHVPLAWARIFLPYGQGENRRRLIPSLVDVFEGKIPPFGVNAAAYRDFLHAADLAEALIVLLQDNASGSYNVCSGQPVRIADVVQKIAALLNADPSRVLGLSVERPGEPGLLVGDNKKLRELGWSAECSLNQGLAKMVL